MQRKFGRWSERLHGESAIELPAKVDNADEWKKRAKSVRSDERNGQQRSIQLIVFVRGWRSEILKPARAALSALSDDTSSAGSFAQTATSSPQGMRSRERQGKSRHHRAHVYDSNGCIIVGFIPIRVESLALQYNPFFEHDQHSHSTTDGGSRRMAGMQTSVTSAL